MDGVKKQTLFFILLYIMVCNNSSIYAQNKNILNHNDSLALENIIVEEYYVSNSTDFIDTTGGVLSKESVTYRIFVDMKPDYNLQLVYGDEKHELQIQTTTTFFNNTICSAETGFNVDAKTINNNTIALDSWVTMGAATRLHTGILKTEDDSVFSFISNRPSLSKTDGLTKGVLPNFQIFNFDLKFFNQSNATKLTTNNGGWAAPGGVKGPTKENRVLIAQLTTNGKLSFKLNVQIGTPNGGFIKFVANNPEGEEIQFTKLSYN